MLRLTEVAFRLKLSTTFLLKEIGRRKLACYRLGRLVRISELDLDIYLMTCRRGVR
jgi:excisionase family DNA binding protein